MASIHETVTSNPNTKSTPSESMQAECLNEFIRTGRTGRRNAVADVYIDPNINLTTTSITDLMYKFDCNDAKNANTQDNSN